MSFYMEYEKSPPSGGDFSYRLHRCAVATAAFVGEDLEECGETYEDVDHVRDTCGDPHPELPFWCHRHEKPIKASYDEEQKSNHVCCFHREKEKRYLARPCLV